MVVGVGLLAMSRAFAEGGHEDWIESGVRIGTGHVTLQTPDFHARRTIEHRMGPAEVEAVLDVLEAPALSNTWRSSCPYIALFILIQRISRTAGYAGKLPGFPLSHEAFGIILGEASDPNGRA